MKKQTAEDKALDLFADLMIQKIETISKDWSKPWFNEGSLMTPKSIYGREYNGMNSLMLTMHCESSGYELPIFATFNKIVSLNFNSETKEYLKDLPHVGVNKGEKSFPIILKELVAKHKVTRKNIRLDEYKRLSEEEKADYDIRWFANVYNVFNIAQTNIAQARPELYAKCVAYCQAPKHEETDTSFQWPALDSILTDNKWVCPILPMKGDNAYYSPSKDHVVIPRKQQFTSGEAFYGTMLHEMAHSTGHKDRLNRLKATHFGSPEYAKEELVAELTAAVVCQRYGIGKSLNEQTAAYLKSWLECLQKEPSFIKDVLYAVKPASAMIGKVIDELTVAPTGGGSSEKSVMQQWEVLKTKHPDAILLFRMGEFYEAYEEDAINCADILGITLTRHNDGYKMAGFPNHALDTYLPKLIRAGHRVAICDNIETPKTTTKRVVEDLKPAV